jgi:hypothetical protein
MTTIVTVVMKALEPSPGILKALVFSAGVLGLDMDSLALVDDGQYFFAHADKLRFRLHFARIAML